METKIQVTKIQVTILQTKHLPDSKSGSNAPDGVLK